jgi:hypothetical protein
MPADRQDPADRMQSLIRRRFFESGHRYAPGYVFAHCGVYSDWQRHQFMRAITRRRLAGYDREHDAFYIL